MHVGSGLLWQRRHGERDLPERCGVQLHVPEHVVRDALSVLPSELRLERNGRLRRVCERLRVCISDLSPDLYGRSGLHRTSDAGERPGRELLVRVSASVVGSDVQHLPDWVQPFERLWNLCEWIRWLP